MMKISLIAIALSFTMLSTGCAIFNNKNNTNTAQKQMKQKELLDGTWELTYVEGGEISKLYQGKIPFIKFDSKNNSIEGFNGCNTFSGKIDIDGNKISYPQPFMQTLKACDGKGEEVFIIALDKSRSFAFTNNNTLNLISGDLGQMEFKRIK